MMIMMAPMPAPDDVRKTLRMPKDLWHRVSEHRFAYRYDTETDVLLHLLERGLEMPGYGPAPELCEDCRNRPRLRGYRVCSECWGDRSAADVLDAAVA